MPSDAYELHTLATACCVSATQLSLAVDNYVSARTFQRYMKTGRLPVDPLRVAVFNDIVCGLKYAYAVKSLPVDKASIEARIPQDRDAEVKRLNITRIKDAIYEARTMVNSSS